MVEISGRVESDSQFRLPTIIHMSAMCLYPSGVCRSVAFGTLSTGWPEQYGIFGLLTTGLSKSTIWQRLLMNSSCVIRILTLPSSLHLVVNLTPRK
jgi:hypothetical protein